jgi:biopolymer transport protein ExbB/TolQ
MKPEQKKPLIGIVSGAVLVALGPVVGLIVTVVSLQQSFSAVEGNAIDPSNKAKVLASGISSSMNATAIGIGLAGVGLVVLIVSLAMFLRAKPAAELPSRTP